MYKIKTFLIATAIMMLQLNSSQAQSKLTMLDSLIGILHPPKGITVYPIDFQKIKVSEEFLLILNEAHYHAVAQSGLVNVKYELSKKYVKKNEYDVSFGSIIGHSPKNLISTLKVRALDQNGGADSDFTPLISAELLAEHSIYDITSGKQLHMKVLHIKPLLTNIKNRSDQNKELAKMMREQITSELISRFPKYTYLTSVSKIEKDKAIMVDIDNIYSMETQKKDLYVNIIKNVYFVDKMPFYLFETIGRVDFDKKINEKISNYKVSKGKEEINTCFANSQTMILSIKPME